MSAEIITLSPYKVARLNFSHVAAADGNNAAYTPKRSEQPFIPTDYARMERPVCGRCTLLLAAVIVVGLPSLVWLVELCGRLA